IRSCARTVTSTRRASRNTRRCFETPGWEMRGNSDPISPAARGRRASKSRTARRVGSAMAAKTLVTKSHPNLFSSSAKNAAESRAKSASFNLTSSPSRSFRRDFSGGSVRDATADCGHPASLSTCNFPPLRRIELHRTRTSFNGLPSFPSMPESRCTNMQSRRRTWSLKKRFSNSFEAFWPTSLRYARKFASTRARHAAMYAFGYFFIPSMASGLSRRYRARLEQRQVVPVRIGEVGREAVVRLDGCRIFELQPAGFEGLEVLPQIVRLEYPVVAAAARLRGRPRIQLVLALEEDHLDVHSLRGDRQPTKVARVLIVRALLEPEHLRVELQGSVLVAHDDGHVCQFFDHGRILRSLYYATVI